MFIRDECEHISIQKPPMSETQRRAAKLSEVGAACEATIYAGVKVETSEGKKQFSLKAHDQTELMALKPQLDALLQAGILDVPAIPYHADGELCRLWTAADFGAILQNATAYIFYHRTYCNHLNVWIRRAESDELPGIFYGAELPADLMENMLALIAAQQGEE